MSSDRYRATLHEWAARYVPTDARVIGVEVYYDDGYDYTYGGCSPTFRVSIEWRPAEGGPAQRTYLDESDGDVSLGGILTALFKIEEES